MDALIFVIVIILVAKLLTPQKPCEACGGTKKEQIRIIGPDGSTITVTTKRPCPVCSKN